jgi:hypothetical protein
MSLFINFSVEPRIEYSKSGEISKGCRVCLKPPLAGLGECFPPSVDNVGRMEGGVKKDDKDKQGRTRMGTGMDANGREWTRTGDGGRAGARGRGGGSR